jgi:hypothetical protein
MSTKHAHGMDCCWPCFNGQASHPVPDEDGRDPLCDENCPVPKEEA